MFTNIVEQYLLISDCGFIRFSISQKGIKSYGKASLSSRRGSPGCSNVLEVMAHCHECASYWNSGRRKITFVVDMKLYIQAIRVSFSFSIWFPKNVDLNFVRYNHINNQVLGKNLG